MRIVNRETGFTLIELLVTLGIVGILSSIAVPTFRDYKVKAYDASALSDMRNIAIAQETYYVDFEKYGSCSTALCLGGSCVNGGCVEAFSSQGFTKQGDRSRIIANPILGATPDSQNWNGSVIVGDPQLGSHPCISGSGLIYGYDTRAGGFTEPADLNGILDVCS